MGCAPSHPDGLPITMDDNPRPELKTNATLASSTSVKKTQEQLNVQTDVQHTEKDKKMNGVANGVGNGVVNGVDKSSPKKEGEHVATSN